MKSILISLILVVFVACGGTQMVQTPDNAVIQATPPLPPAEPNPIGTTVTTSSQKEIKEVAFSNVQGITEIMNFLASDDLKGRDSGSKGIEKAAKFIEAKFTASGVKPYYASYRDVLSNFSPEAFNMVGVVEGNDPILKNEYIVIGAHYDHIGIVGAVNGDTIANGANDNASGTTTVLELARYFGSMKTNKRSLIFALFSAEEKGLLGSKHLAKRMKGENLNLYAMLNFEMVGVPLRDKDYEMYVTGYEKSNLAEVSNTYAGGKLIGYLPTAKQYQLFFRSDNYPFAQEFGVPAQTYCTFDFTNFDFYHKPDDEISEMDFSHMAAIVNKSIPMVEGIANGPLGELQLNE
ncbi:M28 family metallopeptidase [Croceivirga thetidis]|uniref:M28 family peptidase n=1 Tax=Croceivirga thetidis TaxID=2721623 RepID=A0ABX1GTK6_9FLAO|nr:M28 family peptidase [Croceivirga thetidis]NKI33294.1 M28 family peptidase [Croceivirga thetidis]